MALVSVTNKLLEYLYFKLLACLDPCRLGDKRGEKFGHREKYMSR